MDLEAANRAGPSFDPEWTLLYDAKTEYRLSDLTPNSMNDLFERMLADRALFELYFK